jgi:transcriptional regulator with XRE-family HTH domain
MDQSAPTLPATLREARHAARLSQLELSLRLGVSQRHVSFVESGRARPSRGLLLSWLREIKTPLAVANSAMVQAGFAPVFGEGKPDDKALAQARSALSQLLTTHDPMPAFVLNADWDVVEINGGGLWLASVLMPELLAESAGQGLNMLDALIHPLGPLSRQINLAEAAPNMLAHLRHDMMMRPSLAPKVNALTQAISERLGPTFRLRDVTSVQAPLPPVMTNRFQTPLGTLSFFNMFTTFGTPQDITLASLRVEHLFAADEATATIIRNHARTDLAVSA